VIQTSITKKVAEAENMIKKNISLNVVRMLKVACTFFVITHITSRVMTTFAFSKY